MVFEPVVVFNNLCVSTNALVDSIWFVIAGHMLLQIASVALAYRAIPCGFLCAVIRKRKTLKEIDNIAGYGTIFPKIET